LLTLLPLDLLSLFIAGGRGEGMDPMLAIGFLLPFSVFCPLKIHVLSAEVVGAWCVEDKQQRSVELAG
jgi:hypothetical protein